jgi:hypothetical protein
MNIKQVVQRLFAKPSLQDIAAEEQAKRDSHRQDPALPDVGDINDRTSQPVIGSTPGGGSTF